MEVNIFQCEDGQLNQQIYLAFHIMNSKMGDIVIQTDVVNQIIDIAHTNISKQYYCITSVEATGEYASDYYLLPSTHINVIASTL